MFRLSLLIILYSSSSFAQEGGFASCHGLTDDTARLQCYDQATEYAAPVEAPAADTMIGPSETVVSVWQVKEEKSQLEDRTDVWLSVASDNTQPNQIGQPELAGLYIRCMDNATNAFIVFNDYTSDDQTVKYKTDDGDLQSIWMQTMNGGQGIGVWSGSKSITFIKSLYGKQKLVLAYDSYSNHNLEFVFRIDGLEDKIGVVSEACGWN